MAEAKENALPQKPVEHRAFINPVGRGVLVAALALGFGHLVEKPKTDIPAIIRAVENPHQAGTRVMEGIASLMEPLEPPQYPIQHVEIEPIIPGESTDSLISEVFSPANDAQRQEIHKMIFGDPASADEETRIGARGHIDQILAAKDYARIWFFEPFIRQMAEKYGLDPDLFVAQIFVESHGKPDAVSETGNVGLGQVSEKNAIALGFSAADRYNFVKNLEMSAQLDKPELDIFKDPGLMLLAYISGRGNVLKAIQKVVLDRYGYLLPNAWNVDFSTSSDANYEEAKREIGLYQDAIAGKLGLPDKTMTPINTLDALKTGMFTDASADKYIYYIVATHDLLREKAEGVKNLEQNK